MSKCMTALPTKGVQWDSEKSCFIQHPELQGPASCTMCRKSCHHTIVDPKRNAGTCTKKACPMCKPKSCCGKHHKHYVYNTESMEGVCVRHNDDCTAVCAPVKPDPTKTTVCSKGCNRMLKVAKTKPKPGASSDKELFDIVVCQVDHRIVCRPWKRHGGKKKASPCSTKKWVKPVARCVGFDAAVWNAGPTCIANHAHRDKHPQCSGKLRASALKEVKRCRRATKADNVACKSFAESLGEYY